MCWDVAHPAAHGQVGSDSCDKWKWVICWGTKYEIKHLVARPCFCWVFIRSSAGFLRTQTAIAMSFKVRCQAHCQNNLVLSVLLGNWDIWDDYFHSAMKTIQCLQEQRQIKMRFNDLCSAYMTFRRTYPHKYRLIIVLYLVSTQYLFIFCFAELWWKQSSFLFLFSFLTLCFIRRQSRI